MGIGRLVAAALAGALALAPAPTLAQPKKAGRSSTAAPPKNGAPKPSTTAPAAAPAGSPAPAPSLRPRLPRLWVLDFAIRGAAPPDLAKTLTDAAVREVARAGGVQVLSQADVLAQLGVERQRVLLGCSADRSCLAEIAGAIDADRTLSGTVTVLGNGWLVTASMVDARKIVIIGSAEESLRSTRTEELLEAVKRVVYRAYTGKAREAQAVIQFDVAAPAARVVLDGVEIGRGPFQDTRQVSEGSHRVVVAKEGYATWENVFQLEVGGRAHVAPNLVAVGGAGKTLGWSSIAGAVLAVGLGGLAVYEEADARTQYSRASRMLGAGGVLPVSQSAQSYQDAVTAGRSAHRTAVGAGIAAGAVLGTSLVLGYVAHRQTGEVGPFRF